MSKKKSDKRKAKMQYNSLDFVPTTLRLSVSESRALGIYLYGLDNTYPTKITEIAKRSSSLIGAIGKQSRFIAGLGFQGAMAEDVKNDTAVVINESGQTAYDLLQFCAEQKSNINIAIHVNYNQLGEAVEFNLIQYDFVRKKVEISGEKFSRYIITNIWHLENDRQGIWGHYAKIEQFNRWMQDKSEQINFTALECFAYNPDSAIVREQIEISGGIENYPGQLFYKKRTQDIYQSAIYDSVIDDAQFEAESKLFGLSNIQNGFSSGGFWKFFANLDGTKEIEALKSKISNTTGAINSGRIIAVPISPSADMKMPTNIFEPTQLNNVDKLFEIQKKEAKDNIQQIFSIPNAIIGRDTEGNFATQKMQESYDFYNSITKPLRQELEIELTELFKNSVFASQIKLPIEIIPLKFESSEEVKNNDENEQITAESQAKLKGTVGGVQGILQIQSAVSSGVTQYSAGIAILINIYGYTEEKATEILGEPIQQFSEEEKTIEED